MTSNKYLLLIGRFQKLKRPEVIIQTFAYNYFTKQKLLNNTKNE